MTPAMPLPTAERRPAPAPVTGRVLLVEDDPAVREAAALLLERAGLTVETAGDGAAALHRFRRGGIDLVLLDLGLPEIDGLEVCRVIRHSSQVPLLIVSARTSPDDVVVGLALGADDYVTKPFHPRELIARVAAVLRRAGADDQATVVRHGDLEIDSGAFRARRSGRTLDLTATEFRLLLELALHPGRTMTRHDLLRRVWGYEYLGDSRLVDMAVKRLREKLGDDARQPRWIATVRGVGYRFEGAGDGDRCPES